MPKFRLQAEHSCEPDAPARKFAMHLALIGYRGVGKSTIGPRVAALGGVKAIDADQEIERAEGRSLREIFSSLGEPCFRDLETQMLKRLLAANESCVLSLGGGVILRAENRRLMKSGFTVWLTAPLEVIVGRLELDAEKQSQRPSLTALTPAEEVARLLAERRPYYAECADLTIPTDQLSIEDAAQTILTAWRARDAQLIKR
jgi:shikimate kinase